ncbi:CRISPR-associated protein, Cse2 family [Anaeromyxobacter dehalogenans 2CP-1]|uniref:CRISPR-associated protein, Cse2 family n=1 Tax=Anaeromyxobacter dehalogenans (strain ATCC BAA-258 / DSM 21875 / 2CP-1) TaxID=455488 RepID=B8JDN9_ANAD2|nr:type I-E CRISPR-associated protein Cse2/CasB [Anaeromyxobacter dehalogenans]ACL64134.1 CRISPR-associated protein, Cse2 family [Anaeromyxobacter dehalogenans 2CP-1]
MKPEEHSTLQRSDERSLSSRVNALARAIASGSPGDVAALRRLTPDDPASPAFWRLAAAHLDGALPAGGGEAREEAERSWAAVMSGMALTAGLHVPRRRAGAALAQAGYSELRFERLLRASGPQLFREVRAAAAFLASKAVEFDWTDLAALVLGDGGPSAERTRRALARSFYQQLPTQD